MKYLVSELEGAVNAGLLVAELQQAVIGNDYQGINFIHQGKDTIFRNLGTMSAFKGKGSGNHANGQGTGPFGQLSDYRRRPRSSATTHTGGNEDHVSTSNNLLKFVATFFSCFPTDDMVATSTEASGATFANLNTHSGFRNCQMLSISIHGDKFHPANLLADHSGNCITAGTATANNFDSRRTGNITLS